MDKPRLSKTNIPVIPTQVSFQPISNRHFVLFVPGIDSFLVKKVIRPPYVNPLRRWREPEPATCDHCKLEDHLARKHLVVVIHNIITPSTMEQVEQLIDSGGAVKEITIKFIDPVGAVIGGTVYERCELERVDYDPLDYSNSELSEIKLTFRYNRERGLFRANSDQSKSP